MFNDAQLKEIENMVGPKIEFKPITASLKSSGRVGPKIENRATTTRPRPRKWVSRYDFKEISREGPSKNLCSPAHEAIPYKVFNESKGRYVGDRWSPAPGARNWQVPSLSDR